MNNNLEITSDCFTLYLCNKIVLIEAAARGVLFYRTPLDDCFFIYNTTIPYSVILLSIEQFPLNKL